MREIHYFTFGSGQDMAGHCQPIVADNASQAREKMIETYGMKWSMQYSQDEYLEHTKNGYANEIPLEPIYAQEKPTDGNQ